MKKWCVFLLILTFVSVSLTTPAAGAEKVEIKIAGMKPEGEPETLGMYKFGEILGKLSGGKYEVKVFPNSQLGKENAYIASTRRGTIQMCATGTQTSALFPAMAMLEVPMLFDNLDHARRAMNGGKTFELINKGFPEKSGLRTLNGFPLGFRHFYSKKPLKSMADLQGLKMRVPNIPLYVNFAKECGISGQPMPFAEVPAALDQGVIDGGDSPFADIVALKMYEITPYITLSGHILVIHSLYINEQFYQGLPAQDRKWFDQAARESADYVWDLMADLEKKAVKDIADGGGKISDPSPEFKAAMKEAGKRSWKLFTEPGPNQVPNAEEILQSAEAYRK
ncbi:MAG: TRAP transporter substrate-binding protein [Desulfovibrio sp.]|jgi:tripartite ATP-independent transporter DctP family solute receptor|nr:TRAP transporter substrate-binding protein [Desulfovibrio sp.]